MRVALSRGLSWWIEERIAARPGEHEQHRWLADRFREMRALPLVLDMGGSYAIRADGELVEFDWDAPGAPKPLDDARLVNLALHQGSLKYPELAPLVPSRPMGSLDCRQCKGTGKLTFTTPSATESLVCYCGGLGWLPADSDR